MMSRPALLFALLVSSLISGSGTAVAARVEYNCPDLHNEKKRSIEPLTQGYDGWFFRNNDLKMDFSISPESAQYFGRLSAALERRGVRLVMVPLLSRALMAPGMINHDDPSQANYDPALAEASYGKMIESLRAQKISVVDLSPLVKSYGSGDPYEYNFKRDIHWKPEGAQLVAQETAKELAALPEYAGLSKVDVNMKKGGQVGRAGTIREEIQKLCRGEIEPEYFNEYKPEKKSEGTQDALFGDVSESPVHLVGTSFSAVDEFGFVNFLEKESHVEVINFAIAGGEMFSSLLSYLSSPLFAKNNAKIMLWETQSIYDFNKGMEYGLRQAIPAVEGPCPDDRTVARAAVDVTEDRKDYALLANLEKLRVGGSDYYLHIFADNPGFKQFSLEMEYDDQDGEWFPVDRSDRYNDRGHYYIELSDKILGNLSMVSMKDTPDIQTHLEIRLCRKAGKPEPAGKQAVTNSEEPAKQPSNEKELP